MDKRYRLDDSHLTDHEPILREFVVVRKTPAGAWVIPFWDYARTVKPLEEQSLKELRDDWGAQFVLDGEGKRFAHETVELARYSYRRRKLSQIKHARNAIKHAEAALHWLETGELPQPEVFAFDVT